MSFTSISDAKSLNEQTLDSMGLSLLSLPQWQAYQRTGYRIEAFSSRHPSCLTHQQKGNQATGLGLQRRLMRAYVDLNENTLQRAVSIGWFTVKKLFLEASQAGPSRTAAICGDPAICLTFPWSQRAKS
jgi:hypothetical protein